MGPEEWKGERKDEGGRKDREHEEAPREAVDPREEEGWGQPESSAQKLPPGAEEDESIRSG